MNLAIIPARGQSKGVKRKNIRKVAGEPLIHWTIVEAKKSKLIDKLIVSTEDDEIRRVAENLDVEVVQRPMDIAKDETSMIPVLQHAYKEVKQENKFENVILLQPTTPMRKYNHIDQAIKIFCTHKEAQSLVSVYMVDDCHPARMYSIEKGRLKKIMDEPKSFLRQDLPPIYHRNGAIYVCKRNLLINESRLTCDEPIPFIMNKEDSINIDDESDLLIADLLITHINSKM